MSSFKLSPAFDLVTSVVVEVWSLLWPSQRADCETIRSHDTTQQPPVKLTLDVDCGIMPMFPTVMGGADHAGLAGESELVLYTILWEEMQC